MRARRLACSTARSGRTAAVMLALVGALAAQPWLTELRPAVRRPAATPRHDAPPDRRARALLLVHAGDCTAHLALLDVFERPRVKAAVQSVTVLVPDAATARRVADALLTGGRDLPVSTFASVDRRVLEAGTPARVPTLVLVAPDGRVVFSARAPVQSHASRALASTLEHVADHYVASELSPQPSS